jgi:hypothetical protein
MRKIILHSFIIGLVIMLLPSSVKAQLFDTNELYPNSKVIKGKYYNGSGGRGFWSLDYLDSIGRIISKESYFRKQLMSRHKIVYDKNNNKVFDIVTFDYNNPERVDTFRYEYKYSNKRIIYQYQNLSNNHTSIIELIKNEGDSILKYQRKALSFNQKTDTSKTIYTLRLKNNLLLSDVIHDIEKNSKLINTYEYYDNGRLKRRKIEKIPKPDYDLGYIGGPGSDDEYYQYKFDSEGRIKRHYVIINDKKYKIATYSYK